MRTMPIRELLNRIRRDAEFARENFKPGYFDRLEKRIIVVPFAEVSFPRDKPQAFRLVDEEERIHRVPFHRVREVYNDGPRIWNRKTTDRRPPPA